MAEKGSNLQQFANQIGNELTNVAQKLQTYENVLSQDIQRDILLSLYNIRNTFNQELDNLEKNISSLGGSKVSDEELEKKNQKLEYRMLHLEKNLKELMYNDTEKERLQKENEKLKYRIEILLRNITDAK